MRVESKPLFHYRNTVGVAGFRQMFARVFSGVSTPRGI
jgi:hypothetical protein